MYRFSPSWDQNFRWISLLFLVAVLPALVLSSGAPVAADSEQKPALRVDDETVSQQEFERQVQQMVDQMNRRKKAKQGSDSSSGIDEKKLEGLVKQRLKKQLVNRLVLKVHAENEGVEVPEDQLNQRWKKMVERFGSEEKFNKVISESGETPESVRNQIRDSLRVEKFIQQKTAETTVTDEEARSFYEKNSERLKGKSFESVKSRIKRVLKQRKEKQAVQQLVQRLKKQSDIEVNV